MFGKRQLRDVQGKSKGEERAFSSKRLRTSDLEDWKREKDHNDTSSLDSASPAQSAHSSILTVDSGVHFENGHRCTFPGCKDAQTFSTKSKLHHHQIKHIPYGDRPHGCPHEGCDFRFHYPKDLLRHELTHVDSKDLGGLKCRRCSSKLMRKDNYLRHMSTVHGIKLPDVADLTCPPSTEPQSRGTADRPTSLTLPSPAKGTKQAACRSDDLSIPRSTQSGTPMSPSLSPSAVQQTYHGCNDKQPDMLGAPSQPSVTSSLTTTDGNSDAPVFFDGIMISAPQSLLHTKELRSDPDGTEADRQVIDLTGDEEQIELDAPGNVDANSDGDSDEEWENCQCLPFECHANPEESFEASSRPTSDAQTMPSGEPTGRPRRRAERRASKVKATGSRQSGNGTHATQNQQDLNKTGGGDEGSHGDDHASDDGSDGDDGGGNDPDHDTPDAPQGRLFQCPFSCRCPQVSRGAICRSCCMWDGAENICTLVLHLVRVHAKDGAFERIDRFHRESEFRDPQTGQVRFPNRYGISRTAFKRAVKRVPRRTPAEQKWDHIYFLIFPERLFLGDLMLYYINDELSRNLITHLQWLETCYWELDEEIAGLRARLQVAEDIIRRHRCPTNGFGGSGPSMAERYHAATQDPYMPLAPGGTQGRTMPFDTNAGQMGPYNGQNYQGQTQRIAALSSATPASASRVPSWWTVGSADLFQQPPLHSQPQHDSNGASFGSHLRRTHQPGSTGLTDSFDIMSMGTLGEAPMSQDQAFSPSFGMENNGVPDYRGPQWPVEGVGMSFSSSTQVEDGQGSSQPGRPHDPMPHDP